MGCFCGLKGISVTNCFCCCTSTTWTSSHGNLRRQFQALTLPEAYQVMPSQEQLQWRHKREYLQQERKCLVWPSCCYHPDYIHLERRKFLVRIGLSQYCRKHSILKDQDKQEVRRCSDLLGCLTQKAVYLWLLRFFGLFRLCCCTHEALEERKQRFGSTMLEGLV